LLQLSGHGLAIDAVTADILESDVPNLQLIDFKLPPPGELSDEDRAYLMKNSVSRIWQEGQDSSGDVSMEPIMASRASTTEMWMLLIVRMVTRVAIPPSDENIDADAKKEETEEDALESDFYVRQDGLRQTLCDYVMSDFPARCVWL
jgi:symplekin